MNINRKNYESYFLDYFENRLQPEQVAVLMAFLDENPDLKTEFEAFEPTAIKPDDSVSFDLKKKLTKPDYQGTQHIDAWNYEEKMVASIEGDLSPEGEKELHEFLEINPKAKLELALFRKTILIPGDTSFENKHSLKKRGMFILYRKQIVRSMVAAAGVVLLFFGLYSVLNRPVVNSRQTIEQPSLVQSVEIDQIKIDADLPLISQRTSQFEVSGTMADQHEPDLIVEKETSLAGMVLPETSVSIAATGIKEPSVISSINTFDGFYVAGHYKNKKEQRSFAARFISGFVNRIIGDPIPEKKSFLEITIEGYNMVADREVEVEKELDRNGKVVAYNVNGENIAFRKKTGAE